MSERRLSEARLLDEAAVRACAGRGAWCHNCARLRTAEPTCTEEGCPIRTADDGRCYSIGEYTHVRRILKRSGIVKAARS